MALYSKRQFADLAGVPTNNLSNYIKRGHVILHGGDCRCPKNKCKCLINGDDPKNQLFLERQGVTQKPVTVEREPERAKTIQATPQSSKNRLIQLQEEKLARQNQELENKNRLLEAKIQKAYEEVLPREMASFLINNYAASITDVWLTATERFFMQKSVAMGLSREEMIEHKKYIREIVNDAVKRGAAAANANVRKLAAEYAGKKGRGERED